MSITCGEEIALMRFWVEAKSHMVVDLIAKDHMVEASPIIPEPRLCTASSTRYGFIAS